MNASRLLNEFSSISLEEMMNVRLMNRMDTKFTTVKEKLNTILLLMKEKYFVQEINGNRISEYQTVYLDTETLAMYMAHQNGHRTRQKIRVRKYKDTGQIFLEVKNKNNKGRTQKTRIQISALDDLYSGQTDLFIRERSEFHSDQITPCLETIFSRITLVNKEMTERLTIDVNLAFQNYNTRHIQWMKDLVIIELKQEGNTISPAREILAGQHIHPVSISKYCLGSILTDPALKHNRFKRKLMQINKITDYQYGYIS